MPGVMFLGPRSGVLSALCLIRRQDTLVLGRRGVQTFWVDGVRVIRRGDRLVRGQRGIQIFRGFPAKGLQIF